ncbi:eukaryotic rRNA processing protein EBP2-domain-containing protein [Russula vinacea]|nr:eukaryotic rRNA processing protein EBP2-domain-containing protein [Russula vinacea]
MAARAFAALHSVPFHTAGQLFCRNSQDRCGIWNASNSVCSMRGIAKSEARRRKREGKKIGEQVQLEKLKERERSKKDMQERLKGLKRSNDDEPFDVAVEDAIADRRPEKRGHGRRVGSSLPRHVCDKKIGFGAHGKRDKQNTRSLTDDFSGSARRDSSAGSQGKGRGRGHNGTPPRLTSRSKREATPQVTRRLHQAWFYSRTVVQRDWATRAKVTSLHANTTSTGWHN